MRRAEFPRYLARNHLGLVVPAAQAPCPVQGNGNHQIHIGKMWSRKEPVRKLSRKEPAFRGVYVIGGKKVLVK